MTPQKLYLKTEYLVVGDCVRAVCCFAEKVDAVASLAGATLIDLGNLREPHDYRAPYFEMSLDVLQKAGSFTVTVTGHSPGNTLLPKGQSLTFDIPFDPAAVVPPALAMTRADRHLQKETVTERGEAGGIRFEIARYRTEEQAPVMVYTLWADLSRVCFSAGTPGGETAFAPYYLQTVMEEALCAEAGGQRVLAATNADFFDMFGDGAPAGLCVHRGFVVAGAESPSPFLARLRNGTTGIFKPGEVPLDDVEEAVAGNKLLLVGGKRLDLAPLEPFGETPHPRTAVGLDRTSKTLILTVVDGRRPARSNGATLADLAGLMLSAGAHCALNLDGGGSSTFIVRQGDLVMKNQPADLERPDEDLIRPLFDTVLLTARP